MRNRRALTVGIIALLVLLLLGGTVGAMALTHSGFMGNGYPQMMGTQQGYPTLMGSQPSASGMMGGNQPTSTLQGTPATSIMQVTMHNAAYRPGNIQIRVGTTVTWTNQDNVPHTVTFRNGTLGSSMMGSTMVTHGQSFSYMFRMPGMYQYYCAVHPYMVAMVTVVS